VPGRRGRNSAREPAGIPRRGSCMFAMVPAPPVGRRLRASRDRSCRRLGLVVTDNERASTARR
jgi:hypothetical protein